MNIAKIFIVAIMVMQTAFAGNYFADPKVQALAPKAFALQPETIDFHKHLEDHVKSERESLIELIKDNHELALKIENFKDLNWNEKEKVLREVFSLEVKSMNIVAPKLVIDSTSIKGEAFFEFDVVNPTPGIVYINPEVIQKDSNPYTALMLLIHETRHSAQFQKAFLSNDSDTPEAIAYKEAFVAQKKFSNEIVGFCDFLTLNNEYEAFQFGNYVVTSLTHGRVDTLGMGTYASQYNADLTLKIDVPELFRTHEGHNVLEAFNKLEKAQYDLLIKQ